MDLLGLALSLSLPLQGGNFTGDYSFDLSPTFALEAPTGLWGAAATALPGLVLYDPLEMERVGAMGETRQEVMRHELMHGEQQRALGPAFWAAYALSGGQPFEPRHQHTLFPSREAAFGMDERMDTDLGRMWMPPEHMQDNFPIFRLASEGGATRLQFLPGYPELLRIEHEQAPIRKQVVRGQVPSSK